VRERLSWWLWAEFRGETFVAQEHGAAGVIIYSDPADDGWKRATSIRRSVAPDTGVQRGSVGTCFILRRPNFAGSGSLCDLADTSARRGAVCATAEDSQHSVPMRIPGDP